MNAGSVFVWEMLGTSVLVLLGTAVVANNVLRKTNGNGGGILFVTVGWAFAVFAGASIADPSGAHINPAVTFGLAVSGDLSWADVPIYWAGQMVGGVLGAALTWLTYEPQFDDHPEPWSTRGVVSTIPTIPTQAGNTVPAIMGR